MAPTEAGSYFYYAFVDDSSSLDALAVVDRSSSFRSVQASFYLDSFPFLAFDSGSALDSDSEIAAPDFDYYSDCFDLSVTCSYGPLTMLAQMRLAEAVGDPVAAGTAPGPFDSSSSADVAVAVVAA